MCRERAHPQVSGLVILHRASLRMVFDAYTPARSDHPHCHESFWRGRGAGRRVPPHRAQRRAPNPDEECTSSLLMLRAKDLSFGPTSAKRLLGPSAMRPRPLALRSLRARVPSASVRSSIASACVIALRLWGRERICRYSSCKQRHASVLSSP